jgi:nuclear pore complex protein Nup133
LDELVGKGCTDGDLCIRFPSEDIRQPIIRENALDEADFHRYVETANLEKWYAASVRAAKWMLQREKKVDWSLPPVPEGEVRGAVRAVEEKETEGGEEEVVQESMEVEDERIAESRDMEMVEA